MAAWPLARTVAAAFAATMLVTACSSGGGAAPSAAGAQGRVIALTKMSVLRTLFNRDQGHARLVLIFSPT
jgi:ABC-type glycerol-3-phosphate transport system substrate-binding protein